MVTVVCYGKKETWNSREAAMDFYFDAMLGTEGSEQERYTKIFMELYSGKSVCTDEYEY